MIFEFVEILNLIIATAVVGYIFSGIVKLEKEKHFERSFDWRRFKYAVLVSAPGVILHELAHKFVAMGFGLHAVFEIYPFGLVLGIILKLIGSGFIFLAPGYVSIYGANNLAGFFSAFAGPLTNGLLYLIGYFIVKHCKTRKYIFYGVYTKEINKWLFIFNLIPIPPLDGYKVFMYLFRMF